MYKKNILNNFKILLGQYCAINQFIELSKRYFTEDYKTEIKNRKSFMKLATEKELTLTRYDAEYMVNEVSRSYIVNVNICFERFLKDACELVKNYGKGTYKDKCNNESHLKCAVKNIVRGKMPQENQELFELCEYYRLIRNKVVHNLDDDNALHKKYKTLQKHDFEKKTKFFNLNAPNEYENISYDDFILFSRSCVKLATYLYNMISYDYKKIIDSIPRSQISQWKKYKPERFEQSIFSYINTLYKVNPKEETQIHTLIDFMIKNNFDNLAD